MINLKIKTSLSNFRPCIVIGVCKDVKFFHFGWDTKPRKMGDRGQHSCYINTGSLLSLFLCKTSARVLMSQTCYSLSPVLYSYCNSHLEVKFHNFIHLKPKEEKLIEKAFFDFHVRTT